MRQRLRRSTILGHRPRILWRHLRNRNFAGYKFRRQHPLDCYILDFYCPAGTLAIELDGGGIIIVLGKFGIELARNIANQAKQIRLAPKAVCKP